MNGKLDGSYDYLAVGGGTAGCVLANRLGAGPKSVRYVHQKRRKAGSARSGIPRATLVYRRSGECAEAHARGILFDVGHGYGGFAFDSGWATIVKIEKGPVVHIDAGGATIEFVRQFICNGIVIGGKWWNEGPKI